MAICCIQWIDERGNPTPDANPAIGRVRREAHSEPDPRAVNGRIDYSQSEWFPICAEHRARMRTMRGMQYWTFESFADA